MWNCMYNSQDKLLCFLFIYVCRDIVKINQFPLLKYCQRLKAKILHWLSCNLHLISEVFSTTCSSQTQLINLYVTVPVSFCYITNYSKIKLLKTIIIQLVILRIVNTVWDQLGRFFCSWLCFLMCLERGSANFFCKGPVVNILSFVGHTISVKSTQPC